ncbi:DUF5067 domain-containing protein [Bifidobacterium adolescentis]|nr:DUF5067 domain-containing protein [Bifidobacterium adolescentis]MDB1402265.1 DUF5067 domain-containing protein [Bifidobacterium adolescentis]MDB1418281.1 DUF5067 domain-containing protein [Bifidobacterium adolescentis]MDB1420040.1 DUF5067 domain-containing protein [Bifidobacterium adolescentis]MDB1422225.1 DUF5067 domain-containing protein [Bifidobacterium adolescentis]MDB1425435.1 DUF5067 domain-containing protein [Bifidobacterium adolescentis]
MQPQPPLQPVCQEEKGLTVCGIVGVVFGALGFVLSFIPIINNIAAIFGFIGVILAIVALVGTFRGKKRGKALAIVAAVLSVLAIVITLAMQSAASKAIDEATGVSSSQSSAKGSAKNQPKGDQDMEGDLKTMHVKIVSAVRSNNDYNNQPTVLVTFEWTNNTDKNNSFAVLASPQVFQNGQALDTAIYSENPAGYDSNSDFAEVQPGATGTVTIGYTLKDDSEVTVDVTDLFDLNDSAKVVHKFTV